MRFLTYNELKRFPPYSGKPVSPPHAQPVLADRAHADLRARTRSHNSRPIAVPRASRHRGRHAELAATSVFHRTKK